MATPSTSPKSHAERTAVVDAALDAVREANLTDAGYQFLLGALVATSPEAVHATLYSLREFARAESGRSFRYFADE